jgi:hypothetical protein
MPKIGGLGGLGGIDLDDLNLEIAKDVAKSAAAGYLRGTIALLGTPADLGSTVEDWVRQATRRYSGETAEEQEANLRRNAFGYGLKDTTPAFGSRGITEQLYRLSGQTPIQASIQRRRDCPHGSWFRAVGRFCSRWCCPQAPDRCCRARLGSRRSRKPAGHSGFVFRAVCPRNCSCIGGRRRIPGDGAPDTAG